MAQSQSQYIKAREARRSVVIQARMMDGASWKDVCIRNISSRGLLLHTESPPRPGSYVDIRRGWYTIVGRVIWSSDRQFGVNTQDALSIDDIVQDRSRSRQPSDSVQNAAPVERRTSPRNASHAHKHELNRQLSSTLQFSFLVLLSLFVAGTAFALVRDALAHPLTSIASNL